MSYEKVKNEAGFFFEVELTIGDKEIYICDRILSEFDKKKICLLKKKFIGKVVC